MYYVGKVIAVANCVYQIYGEKWINIVAEETMIHVGLFLFLDLVTHISYGPLQV